MYQNTSLHDTACDRSSMAKIKKRTDDNEQYERREPVCSCVCYCRVLTEDTFEPFEQIDGACCHR